MKIKQFFIDNKDFLKKLFQFLLCFLVVLLYTISIFACGYNVKTSLYDSNKKELVNRKNSFSGNIHTNMSTMITNIVSSSQAEGQLVLILHIVNVNLGYYFDQLEFELEYTLLSRYYYSNNAYIEQYHPNLYGYFYSEGQFDTLSNLELSFYPHVVISEGGFDDSILHPSYDFLWECDVSVLNDEDVIIQANGPLYFSFSFAPTIPNQSQEIAESLINFFTALDDYGLTNMTFNNSISFNLDVFDHYYNNGYEAGKKEQEDYYEELIIPAVKIEYEEIGYSNGYDVGYEEGKIVGYDKGLSDGRLENNSILKPFELMVKGVEPVILVLSSEIAPGITIGTIALIPLAVTMIVFLLKGLVL